MTGSVGRRAFLTGAAATAAAIVAGCSSDGGSDGEAAGTATTTAGGGAPATTPTTSAAPPDLGGDPFTLGVASGDPTAEAVVIWTRLAPDPLADDGAGGMPDDDVEVIWEVATDAAFAAKDLVAAGTFTATAALGHSVHVDVTGLDAGTDYHYRFTVGATTSPVGRTRTLADGSPERFALAIANCQMLESGAYGAYRQMVEEDLDLVVHLGDYIYEYPGDGKGGRSPAPARALATLADYRIRYGSYKTDPDLRAAHARFPFVATWDDHDVANNYMGDTLPGDPDTADGVALKTAAYQAWWEHLPVRLDPPTGDALAVYRAFAVGDLVRLHLLDERQDAAVPPCRPATGYPTDYGDCDARIAEGEDRTRLGPDQEAWLETSLAEGGVTWNLLGNPVVLAGVDAGTDSAGYWLDTWDGYPQARERLIAQLAEASNPVVLTGDYHAGMTLDVRATPFDQESPIVATEFMSPPISSVLFPQDVSPRTPQLREQLNNHGYLTVEVTPTQLTAAFRVLDDVADAASGITTASTWIVDAGTPTARRA